MCHVILDMRRMTKSKVFLSSCLFFIAGIAVASFLPENIVAYKFIWFSALVIGGIFLFLFRQNKKIMLASLFGCFLFLGVWRYSLSLPINSPDKIWFYNGQSVKVAGVISKEPDIREKNQKIEINVKSVETQNFASEETRHGVFPRSVSGKILISADLFPEYQFGDRLEMTGELKTPTAIDDFSYDRYLARYDIYSVCYYPSIRKINEPGVGLSSAWIYRQIFTLKAKIRETINLGLSDPEAGLALGVMIGDRRGIGADLNNRFSQTGLTHIMAVSGMNTTINYGFSFGYRFGAPPVVLFFLFGSFSFYYFSWRSGFGGQGGDNELYRAFGNASGKIESPYQCHLFCRRVDGLDQSAPASR
jgi:predicted membrane metal-binding protein